jgi:hypothetical protein
MMRADAGLHADQARWHVGKPGFHLATGPLLPQHNGSPLIETHDVERVLADIDADDRDHNVDFLRHGMLLLFGATCQLTCWAGKEHGRTIPLAVIRCNRPVGRTLSWPTKKVA